MEKDMIGLILSLLLAVTPGECKNDPAWCLCRREVAKDYNRCMIDKQEKCERKYETGKKACTGDDRAVEEYYTVEYSDGSR
jgi:hypothetical protein